MFDLPWMLAARKEIGIKEIKGDDDNKRIIDYFNAVNISEDYIKESTAWCSIFINYIFKSIGYSYTESAMARSWEKWGRELTDLHYGSLLVFKRGNSKWKGHVSFFMYEENNLLYCLGGNQSDKVGIDPYRKEDLISIKWPIEFKEKKNMLSLEEQNFLINLIKFYEYVKGKQEEVNTENLMNKISKV